MPDPDTRTIVIKLASQPGGLIDIEKSSKSVLSNLNRINKQTGTWRDSVRKVSGTLDKVDGVFKSIFNTIGKIGSFAGVTLSLETGVQQALEFSRSLVALSSQFAKYGINIRQVEDQVLSLGKQLALTRKETIGLLREFERGLPYASFVASEKILVNIRNVVGSSADEIARMAQGVMELVSRYPSLQKSAADLNKLDKARLRNIVASEVAIGRLDLRQARMMLDYVAQHRQATKEDEKALAVRKKQIEDIQRLRKSFEEIAISVGEQLLPYMQRFSEILRDNLPKLIRLAEIFGKYIVPLMIGKMVVGAGAGILSQVRGIFGGIRGGVGGQRVFVTNWPPSLGMGAAPGAVATFGRRALGVGALSLAGYGLGHLAGGAIANIAGARGVEAGAIRSGTRMAGSALGGLAAGAMIGGPFGAPIGLVGGIVTGALLEMADAARAAAKALSDITKMGEEEVEAWDKMERAWEKAGVAPRGLAAAGEKFRRGELGERLFKAKKESVFTKEGWIDFLHPEIAERISAERRKRNKLLKDEYDALRKLSDIQRQATKERDQEASKERARIKSAQLSARLAGATAGFPSRYSGLAALSTAREGQLASYMARWRELTGGVSFGRIGRFAERAGASGAGLTEEERLRTAIGRVAGKGDVEEVLYLYHKIRDVRTEINSISIEGVQLLSHSRIILGYITEKRQAEVGFLDAIVTKMGTIGLTERELSKFSKDIENTQKTINEEMVQIVALRKASKTAVITEKQYIEKVQDDITALNVKRKEAKDDEEKIEKIEKERIRLSAALYLANDNLRRNQADIKKYNADLVTLEMDRLKLAEYNFALKQQEASVISGVLSSTVALLDAESRMIKLRGLDEKGRERISKLANITYEQAIKAINIHKELATQIKIIRSEIERSSGDRRVRLQQQLNRLMGDYRKSLADAAQAYETIGKQMQVYIHQESDQMELQGLIISQTETMISTMDNAMMGVGASAQLRIQLLEQIRKQAEMADRKIIRAQEMLAKFPERRVEAEKEIAKAQLERWQLTQKEMAAARQMRDGWITAINAMTVGSGRISKIVMTQTKNTGLMMQYVRGIVQAGKTGAMGGAGVGYATSERFGPRFGEIIGGKLLGPYPLFAAGASTAEAALVNQLAGRMGASREGMAAAARQASRQAAGGGMLGWAGQPKRHGEIIARELGRGGAGARGVGGNLPIQVNLKVEGVGLAERLKSAVLSAQDQFQELINNIVNKAMTGELTPWTGTGRTPTAKD